MLAPVASTEHLKIKTLRMAANHIKILEPALVDALGFYDWFPPTYLGSAAVDAFCSLESKLCTTLVSEVFDPEVNNIPRAYMGVSDLPAGQSYRAMVYYAQSIRGDYKFSLYNYGKRKNKKIYGQKDPPAVPLENYNIPTVL